MATKSKINILLSDYNLLERYSEDLFKFMPLPTALLSPLEVILEFNPAFEEISGYPSEEVVGVNIKKLFSPQEIKKILKKASKQFSVEEEISLIAKKGEIIPVIIFVQTRKARGQKGGYFISLFDLRETKEKEEKLKEINSTLEIRVQAREKELKELAEELEKRVVERKREIKKKIKELDKIRRETVRRELIMVKLKKENAFLLSKIKELEIRYNGE